MLIDIHHHLNSHYYPSLDAYLDDLVRIADEFGVTKFCVNGLGPGYQNFTNDDTETAFHKLPELLIGFAAYDLDDDEPAQIADFAARGFKGLKIINPKHNYDDDAYFPAYEVAAEHGMVCLFHTGFVAPSPVGIRKHSSSARMRPIYLEAIGRSFPEMPIVGAHFGSPWEIEANTMMNGVANIYFDIACGPFHRPPEFFSNLQLQPMNFDKFLFGTDSLARDFAIPFERDMMMFDALHLSPETRRRILYGNAAKILGLE